MDEDIVPSSSYATTIPSSPPFDPRYCAVSPTSSEPPLFSSDDPPEVADVGNYESPRYKRKRVGAWWETESSQPIQERKKAKMTRNFDSGVWLQSDNSDASQEVGASQLPSSDPVVPDGPLFPISPWDNQKIKRMMSEMSEAEMMLCFHISTKLETNHDKLDFENEGLEDNELRHIEMLNQIIRVPLDAGIDVPAEAQFRSMEPELYINLAGNKLQHLHLSLFKLQFLRTLVLRDNQIRELPPQIGKLQNLVELDLSRNLLTCLPREILHLIPRPRGEEESSLRLQLLGNPLLEPPRLAPLSYNDSLETDTTEEAHEIRLCQLYDSLPDHRQPWKVIRRIQIREQAYMSLPSGRQLYHVPVLVGRTPVSYYDQAGRVLRGSPKLPTFGPIDFDVIVDTNRGSYDIPSHFFEPPSSSRVPSLFKLAMNTALRDASITYVRNEMGDDPPMDAEAMLSCAEENTTSTYSPFRQCHNCGKDYVTAAAQWIEFWSLPRSVCVPVTARVCSWGCVPDNYSKRPKELQC